MTDDELVERIRKALNAARHSGDEIQAEVAIRGVVRMLANNLQQFNRVFAAYEPRIETLKATQALGEQIIQLTAERGELRITVEKLKRELQDAQTYRRMPAKTQQPAAKQSLTKLRNGHRLILQAILSGHVTEEQILAHASLGFQNLAARLSEMTSGRHFGGPILRRRRKSKSEAFEITDRGLDLLKGPEHATYSPNAEGDDDAGRRDLDATRPTLHSAR